MAFFNRPDLAGDWASKAFLAAGAVPRGATMSVFCLLMLTVAARAAEPPEPASDSTVQALSPIIAQSQQDLLEPYAGGQVARGGRVGLLGNQDFLDTPFNQTSYTSELIENQQAQLVSDVLIGDPSVRDSGRKYGQASNALMIRGLSFASMDASFNGLRGIFPWYRQPVEALERIEVLKGPNALISGMGTSVAGDINLVPKRAQDEPITRLGLGYSTDSEFGTHIDVGRRFGNDKAWGVRFNGVYRGGDTPVDKQSSHLGMGALGLDYRGERLRASVDLIQQRVSLKNTSQYSYGFASADIPSPPDSDHAGLLGGRTIQREKSASFRLEYDISDALTVHAAAGHLYQKVETVNNSIQNVQPNGDYIGTLGSDAYGISVNNIQLGARWKFATGTVKHNVSLLADQFRQISLVHESGRGNDDVRVPGNIYEDQYGIYPSNPPHGDWISNGVTTRKSLAIADNISFLDERLNLILGVRKQYVEQEGQTRGGLIHYKEDALTPMVGLVIKPTQDFSIYGNYIEGLLQGTIVNDPASPDNGTIFPPYKTKQYEIGFKKDFGQLSTSISLFQITQPSQLVETDASGIKHYSQNGEQRNRGIEWSFFGKLTDDLSVLGGITYLQAKQTRTPNGQTDGNRVPGTAKFQANLGLDWEVHAVPGLALSARAVHTGSVYLDSVNEQKIGSWTRYDVGARYSTNVYGKKVTWRANVDNLFNKNYWIGVNGAAVLSNPRMVSLSATMEF